MKEKLIVVSIILTSLASCNQKSQNNNDQTTPNKIIELADDEATETLKFAQSKKAETEDEKQERWKSNSRKMVMNLADDFKRLANQLGEKHELCVNVIETAKIACLDYPDLYKEFEDIIYKEKRDRDRIKKEASKILETGKKKYLNLYKMKEPEYIKFMVIWQSVQNELIALKQNVKDTQYLENWNQFTSGIDNKMTWID